MKAASLAAICILLTAAAPAWAEDGAAPYSEWEGLPNAWQVPKTGEWIHLGGWAHFDAIYDLKPIGSQGSFQPATIPFDGSKGQSLFFQVTTSRIRLDAAHMTDLGRAQASIEIDFFTSTGAPRIRHAYAEVGRVLAGQTWSTMMDIDTLPPGLDFENPSTFIMRRDPMVRYTQPLGEGMLLQAAAEYPNFVMEAGSANLAPGAFEVRAPDLVLRYRYDRGPLLLSLAGVLRYLRYHQAAGPVNEFAGYGSCLSLRFRATDRLTLWAEGIAGQSIGGYRGFADLDVVASGAVTRVGALGGMGAVTFNWLPSLRSTVIVSGGRGTPQADPSLEQTSGIVYSAINLQWFPVERVMTGVEVLYGERDGYLAGGGEVSSYAVRLQSSMRVMLP